MYKPSSRRVAVRARKENLLGIRWLTETRNCIFSETSVPTYMVCVSVCAAYILHVYNILRNFYFRRISHFFHFVVVAVVFPVASLDTIFLFRFQNSDQIEIEVDTERTITCTHKPLTPA